MAPHLSLASALRALCWAKSHEDGVHDIHLLPAHHLETRTMGFLANVRRAGKMYKTDDEILCPSATTHEDLAVLLEQALIALRLVHGTSDTDGTNREHPTGFHFQAKFLFEKNGETPVAIRWAWHRSWSTPEKPHFGSIIARPMPLQSAGPSAPSIDGTTQNRTRPTTP